MVLFIDIKLIYFKTYKFYFYIWQKTSTILFLFEIFQKSINLFISN